MRRKNMQSKLLRKAINLAIDFTIMENARDKTGIFYIKYKDQIKPIPEDAIKTLKYYPILLSQALTGWNEDHYDREVTKDDTGMDIKKWRGKRSFRYKDYPKTNYLSSEEKTLEACLIELLSEGLV